MTVPGIIDKAEDKEKLVFKNDVATIMPTRAKLTKIRTRKYILKLIISLALILLLLSTILLTFCYIKKIGPFKRIFRGRCSVGNERYGHQRVYESFEITDNYALISVPKFHVKWGSFQSVKTLHVFKKKLTVIQYNGVCFVRPMLNSHGLQRDWFERIGRINFREPPKQITHIHWQLTSSSFSNEYLRENVHEMAAAMCMSRPVFHLKFYTFHHTPRQPCFKKCENCEASNQYIKWENVNGQSCRVCHCKTNEGLKSSNRVDANCKAIRCENKCNGKKLLGCVQCRCADQDQQIADVHTPELDRMKITPLVVDDQETMSPMENNMRVMQDKSKVLIHYQKNPNGFQNRKKRSAEDGCKLVAEVFEGYTPLGYGSKMSVDYIHDC